MAVRNKAVIESEIKQVESKLEVGHQTIQEAKFALEEALKTIREADNGRLALMRKLVRLHHEKKELEGV